MLNRLLQNIIPNMTHNGVTSLKLFIRLLDGQKSLLRFMKPNKAKSSENNLMETH